MNKGWYYRGNLSLYLVAAIWVIGFVAPFMIVAVAGNLLIAGRVAGYEPLMLLVIYCNLWIRSWVFAVAFPTFTACLGLGLLAGYLIDVPLANPLKAWRYLFKNLAGDIAIISLKLAVWEQGLRKLYKELLEVVPDIDHQYTTIAIETDYFRLKERATHAFQVKLMTKALSLTGNKNPVGVVDIGDSAGTHIKYIKHISNKKLNCLSVNMDNVAVEKIKDMGLAAICGRAEEVAYPSDTQIFMTFFLLEHLTDSCGFLHKLSNEPDCKALIMTVPYVKQSRVGLHYIRRGKGFGASAETTHIYEMSPSDWELIFKHSGWAVSFDRIFYQYPRCIPIVSWLLRRFWRRNDFEGFYGAVLTPDDTWSKLYQDWNNDYRGVFTVVRGSEE